MSPKDLARWCAVPLGELIEHPARRAPFRLCTDPLEMGRLMASEPAHESSGSHCCCAANISSVMARIWSRSSIELVSRSSETAV